MLEMYRTIPGFDSDYRVSRNGQVISLKKGKVKFLKARKRPTNGYHQLGLKRDDGRRVTDYVHRLTALAWVPQPSPDKGEVDHKDEDKDNNRDTNLEWVTRSKNIERAARSRSRFRRTHLLLVDPDGEIHEVRGLRAFAEQNQVPHWGLIEMVHGRRSDFRGWVCLMDGKVAVANPLPAAA